VYDLSVFPSVSGLFRVGSLRVRIVRSTISSESTPCLRSRFVPPCWRTRCRSECHVVNRHICSALYAAALLCQDACPLKRRIVTSPKESHPLIQRRNADSTPGINFAQNILVFCALKAQDGKIRLFFF